MSLKYLNDNKQMFENTLCYNQNIQKTLIFYLTQKCIKIFLIMNLIKKITLRVY